jgi:hypothetical protein
VGCRDALWYGNVVLLGGDYAKFPDELKFPELTTEETSKELDLFYSEGANGPVPIVLALRYVRHKANGDSSDKLQELLASLRRVGQ